MNHSEFLRAFGSVERTEWIARHGSIISGGGPCVNAHVRTGGMGRKADACWIVPLTWEEHNELHQHGAATFEAKYRVNLADEAARIESEWKREQEGGEF